MYQKGRYNFRAFGRAIQEGRKKKGLTREELAEMVDRTPRTIMYIEARGQHPSFQVLYEIATILDVSVDQFFFPSDANNRNAQSILFDGLLDEMSEKDLTVLVATARALKAIKESEPEA